MADKKVNSIKKITPLIEKQTDQPLSSTRAYNKITPPVNGDMQERKSPKNRTENKSFYQENYNKQRKSFRSYDDFAFAENLNEDVIIEAKKEEAAAETKDNKANYNNKAYKKPYYNNNKYGKKQNFNNKKEAEKDAGKPPVKYISLADLTKSARTLPYMNVKAI